MIRLVPRSIRAKLALYVLLLLAVLVIGLLASVYLLARGSVWRSFREGLVAEAHSLGSMIDYEGGSFDIELPDSVLSRFGLAPEYYRVFDGLGRRLAVSGSVENGTNLWRPTTDWIRRAKLDDAMFRRIRMGGDEKGLLTLKCLPRIEDEGNSNPVELQKAAIVVQVTRSTRRVRHLLGGLRTILLMGGFLTLAAATLGSRAVANVGLRPVQNLASRVEGINERTLGTRVPHGTLPDELVPLATKTNEMLRRLEDAFQREKRFTSDAAHEIRTPLSALITTLEVALRKNRSPQEYKDMMTGCLSSARHLKQLTQALLFLAALDAGKVRSQSQSVDIKKLLDETVGIYKEKAKKKSLLMATNASVREATLEPELLAPILSNLISNAIEYSRAGDSVSISAYRRDSDKALCIEVADTGPGIAKRDIEKVFYRFYRGPEEVKNSASHAGLGLAIAAKAAEAMGGRIEAESEPGKGSTFRLVIVPRRPPAAAGPSQSNPLTGPGT